MNRTVGHKGNANLHWPFTKRTDVKIALTLDNNVWNFLYDRSIDLAVELPRERFAIFITREVEIDATKAALSSFRGVITDDTLEPEIEEDLAV